MLLKILSPLEMSSVKIWETIRCANMRDVLFGSLSASQKRTCLSPLLLTMTSGIDLRLSTDLATRLEREEMWDVLEDESLQKQRKGRYECYTP